MATPPESILSHTSAPVASQLDRGRKALDQNHHSSLVILPSDGELLMLFTQDADEAAFDRLVERHGGMVWRVCRGVLLAQQDVEDAYQATFLLLASKANKIHANESAAGWLYRVAHRTALAAKRRAKRRREESLEADPAAPPEEAFPNLVGRQMVSLLLEELRAMPKKYQTPLVMRYLEGQSRRSIADQTDMTVAAVQGKLARGKHLLRRRLVRRGVSLSAAMGVVGAASQTSLARSSEAATPTLIAQTAADCHALAAGGGSLAASSAVLALYQEGTRAMLFASMTKPAATLVACSLAAALWVGSGVGGSEPTNGLLDEGGGKFRLSAELDSEVNSEEAPARVVQLTQVELASKETKATTNSLKTNQGFIDKYLEKRESLNRQRKFYSDLISGMNRLEFGNSDKGTSDEQIELSKELRNEISNIDGLIKKLDIRAAKLVLEDKLAIERMTDRVASPAIVSSEVTGLPKRSTIENGSEIENWPNGGLKAKREYIDGRLAEAIEYDESGSLTYTMEDEGVKKPEQTNELQNKLEIGPNTQVKAGKNSPYGSSQQLSNSQPLQQNRSVYLDQPRQQQNYNNNQLTQNWGGRTQTTSAPSQAQLDQIERQAYAGYNSAQLPTPRTIYNPPSRQANSTSTRGWGKSHADSTKSVDEALRALKGMINVSAGECYSLKQVWDNITQRLEERINNKERNNKTDIEKVVDQLSGEELFILQNDLTLLKSYGYSKRNLDRYLATSDELLHYWMVLDGQKDLLDSRDPNKIVYSPSVIEKAKLYVDQITKIRASIERVEAKLPPQEVQNDLAAAVRKNQDKIIHRQDSGSLEIKNFTDQQTKDFELLQKIQTGDKQVPQAIDIIRDIRQRSGNTISGSPNRPPTSSFKSLSELIRDYDDSVEELQEALNQQLDPSPELDVDGDYGPLTKAAVRKFQEKAKLPPTGFADEATRESLDLIDKPLKTGQSQLTQAGVEPVLTEQEQINQAVEKAEAAVRKCENLAKLLMELVLDDAFSKPIPKSYRMNDKSNPFVLAMVQQVDKQIEIAFSAIKETDIVIQSFVKSKIAKNVDPEGVIELKKQAKSVILQYTDLHRRITAVVRTNNLSRNSSYEEVKRQSLEREKKLSDPPSSSKPEPDKESTLEPLSIEPSEKTVKVAKPITELSIKELNQRGWQAFYQGKNKEAEADFREILSRDKKHLAAINGLGFALLNQGNQKEAKPLFKSYLKQDKKALGPMNGLARCLQAEGDLDGAIKVWEGGVKINRGPTALSSGLAFAYLENKEYTKAIPLFEMLAKSDPKNTFYSDGLAKAKAALAEPSKAE